jgi:hypothetical protein
LIKLKSPTRLRDEARKLAVKYRELAKFAQPAYLGDFYRGIAVRYAFMAQEASERANKDGLAPERRGRPEPFDWQGQVEEIVPPPIQSSLPAGWLALTQDYNRNGRNPDVRASARPCTPARWASAPASLEPGSASSPRRCRPASAMITGRQPVSSQSRSSAPHFNESSFSEPKSVVCKRFEPASFYNVLNTLHVIRRIASLR